MSSSTRPGAGAFGGHGGLATRLIVFVDGHRPAGAAR
jgi:hypothetical protein